MEYNTAIGKANADEESNMFRIQGQIARMEAKAAPIKNNIRYWNFTIKNARLIWQLKYQHIHQQEQ